MATLPTSTFIVIMFFTGTKFFKDSFKYCPLVAHTAVCAKIQRYSQHCLILFACGAAIPKLDTEIQAALLHSFFACGAAIPKLDTEIQAALLHPFCMWSCYS